LREVIRGAGLSARKSLGQNFLLDLNVTGRIARAAGPITGQTIVEIGPGPGGLTRALLLEGAGKVIALERDERFLTVLREIEAAAPGCLQVIPADALSVNYPALASGTDATLIVANLPYNIATPLLTGWLTSGPWPPWWSKLVLMFQKEVAERIVAVPRTKAYGRLAVLSQARCTARILFTLPARVFTPSPNVDSSLVEIKPDIDRLQGVAIRHLETVTAAAFGKRRKMLRSSLRELRVPVADMLDAAGIQETKRAEDLSVDEFCRFAVIYAKFAVNPPLADRF
jgi:16S rRNA (adenine1518-N6/adenine1519-N6)-dimethyltransferase